MANPQIRILPDAHAIARAAADIVLEASARAIADRGRCSLVLSGGSTPKLLYKMLAAEPFITRLDWTNLHIYFGDERCVPPEHKDSNFGMASHAMLDHVPIPPANIHRMRGEIDPEPAAVEYGQLLKEHFGDSGPDLTLLGMGDDGHTASLFPGTAALTETRHRCVANHVEKLGAWRITLTPPFINRSREVLVLVSGAGKAPRVQEVLEGEPDPQRLPIQLIQPEGGFIWLLDTDAAGMR